MMGISSRTVPTERRKRIKRFPLAHSEFASSGLNETVVIADSNSCDAISFLVSARHNDIADRVGRCVAPLRLSRDSATADLNIDHFDARRDNERTDILEDC